MPPIFKTRVGIAGHLAQRNEIGLPWEEVAVDSVVRPWKIPIQGVPISWS
jgi:hypothetical protein